jgi:hypothetical protein
MTRSIKSYFSSEKRVSKAIFLVVLAVLFTTVFGSTIYAQFLRSAAGSTFIYGYGYGDDGYGYGYGYGSSGDNSYGFAGTSGAATGVSASASQTTATVSYTTSYSAKNQLNYGLTSGFGSNSSQTSFQSGNNYISLSGLSCGTTYYYRIASEDAGGNVWYDTGSYHTVTTSACNTSHSSGGSSVMTYIPPTTQVPGCPAGYVCTLTVVPGCPVGYICALTISGGNNGAPFFRSLTVGSTGSEVRSLQAYLNNHGFQVASSGGGSMGHETSYFGGLTRAALARFQASAGISPAVGYFGPITRAYINSHR